MLLFSLDATEAVLFSHAPMQMGDMAGMGGGDEEDMMGMMGGGAGGGMGGGMGGMGVSLWPKHTVCHSGYSLRCWGNQLAMLPVCDQQGLARYLTPPPVFLCLDTGRRAVKKDQA